MKDFVFELTQLGDYISLLSNPVGARCGSPRHQIELTEYARAMK